MKNIKKYIDTVFALRYPNKPKDTFTTLRIFDESKIGSVFYSQYGDPMWFEIYIYKDMSYMRTIGICRSEIDFTPYEGMWVNIKIVINDRTKKKSLVIEQNIPKPLTAEDIELINNFY